MKLPLEIVFREMVPLPSLEPEVRRRAARLERFGGELTSCRIVVEASANRRHQGHEYQVTIDVRLPDAELVVSRHHRGDDAPLALRAAFDAMERCLDERARQRRDGPRHLRPAPDVVIRGEAEGGGDALQDVERQRAIDVGVDGRAGAPADERAPPRLEEP